MSSKHNIESIIWALKTYTEVEIIFRRDKAFFQAVLLPNPEAGADGIEVPIGWITIDEMRSLIRDGVLDAGVIE